MSPLFYAVGANGIGYKTFAAAKVRKNFDICKREWKIFAEIERYRKLLRGAADVIRL